MKDRKIYSIKKVFQRLLLSAFIGICFNIHTTNAQCTSTISAFPFNEGFEATNGGWTTGGNLSDWTWGTPTKPVISAAGSGSKCWVTGGLSNPGYNNAENSWLQSPCFDFTSLVSPRIELKVFWETERTFDGANLQYSTDGLTWSVIGTANDDTCLASKWYNIGGINFLGSKPGWSGNIQSGLGSCVTGSGSGSWVNAMHDLSNLAGQPMIIFRFAFAAGTTCNNFDGFAIDDISIHESLLNDFTDFSYTCLGNNTVSFHGISPGCISSPLWSFGDPSSPNNLSNQLDPVHIFTAPGSYTVTLRNNIITSGIPVTIIKNIDLPSLSANVTNSINCAGGTGNITAVVSGTTGTVSYTWNTTPVQTTPTATNLPAGLYTVTISSPNFCTTSQSLTLNEPPAIIISPVVSNAFCGNLNGSIITNVAGGTTPYQYNWSSGAITPSISNLAAGSYSLMVNDANGCSTQTGNLVVTSVNKIIAISLGKDTAICPGQQLILDPGSYALYKWQDNSTSRTFNVTATGNYAVTVTDTSGCKGSSSINILVDCSDILFPTAFTPGHDMLNDDFGPTGNISLLKNYSLQIYNRWGQEVFKSLDPNKKWNGAFKGKDADSGIFLWYARYELNGEIKVKKGTVMLIK